jgi:hypothetical protein
VTWLDAATRWRTWVDRDEPGRVAAYLDSLIEDGATWVEGGKYIDIHTAGVREVDELFWRLEKRTFTDGQIAIWTGLHMSVFHDNVRDRLSRAYPEVDFVYSEFMVTPGSPATPSIKSGPTECLWRLGFSFKLESMLLMRLPNGGVLLTRLANELRNFAAQCDHNTVIREENDFGEDITGLNLVPRYVGGYFRVTIETPPQFPPGSLVRDLLGNPPR